MKELIGIENFNEQEKLFLEKVGKSFSFYYKNYWASLLYFIIKLDVKDMQAAEDFTCRAFMQSLKKIEDYNREKAQFRTWLYTIARNIVFQDKKDQNKVRVTSIDAEIDSEGSTSLKDFIADTSENTVGRRFVSDKKAEIMLNTIKELKEPYRTVIHMREIDNIKYKDIAAILGKNESTIKSQIKNGRAILIKKTKKEFDNLEELYL